MKGISAIISVILILLISIVLVGAAWMYISTYYFGLTRQNIEVLSSACPENDGIVRVNMRNIGEAEIVIPADAMQGNGLVAYYPMEEGDGVIVNDRSGNGNDGKLYGSAKGIWRMDEGQGQSVNDLTNYNNDGRLGYTENAEGSDPTWRPENECVSGSCLQFDGNDFVDVADDDTLDFRTELTVEAWFKPADGANLPPNYPYSIVTKRSNNNNVGGVYVDSPSTFRLFYKEFRLEYEVNDALTGARYSSTESPTESPILNPGEWHYAALTYDGAYLRLYVEGRLNESLDIGSVELYTHDQSLLIGAQWFEGEIHNGNMTGMIDEVAVYNRSLSAAQIMDHYNSRRAKVDGWTAGRIGGGLQFDGKEDFVDAGKGDSVKMRDNLTVEAWIKMNSLRDSYPGGDFVSMSGPGQNIALSATPTASSWNVPPETYQGPERAIDGFVPTWPYNDSREWSAHNQQVGAWIQLNWPAAYVVDRIVLHDKVNYDDHVVAGILTFSDGSSVAVGELPNGGGTGLTVNFPPKTITWVRFTVTQVASGGTETGLAEFRAYPLSSTWSIGQYQSAPTAPMNFSLMRDSGGLPVFNGYGGGTLGLRQWTHVAFTFDSNSGKAVIYQNGSQVYTNPSPVPGLLFSYPDAVLMLGGGRRFNGILDSVALYNRALSAEEIKSHSAITPCTQAGSDYICGDLRVSKTSGPGIFLPHFDTARVQPGNGFVMFDYGCTGFCQYRILTKNQRGGNAMVQCY